MAICIVLTTVVFARESQIYGVLLEPEGKGAFILFDERALETCPDKNERAMIIIDGKGHYRGGDCWESVHKVNVLISVRSPKDTGLFIAPLEAVILDSKIGR